MSAAVVVFGALGALVGTVGCLVVCDLLSQEVRARLFRLPFLILRLAARPLPPELRGEVLEEAWVPEITHILKETELGPLTRLTQATRQALSLWLRRSGAQMAEALTTLAPPAITGFEDVRALPRGRRKEFRALTARLHELLGRPVDAFDPEGAARLLTTTASLCEACIDDRDERSARSLAEAARPLAESLDQDHPAVFGVRRAYAHALLQLGHTDQAEALLRELNADEVRALGTGAPETFLTRRLLGWALVNAGHFRAAEAELRSLMAELPDRATSLWLHIQCMHSWTIFRNGCRRAAEDGYDAVIASRTRRFGPDHPDTLDARHSKGKMRVLSGEGLRARAVLQPLLADRRRVLGTRHPDTLETRKYLAVADALARPHGASGAPGAPGKALRKLRHIARAQTRSLGSGHPHTHDTVWWLTTFTRSGEDG